MSNDRSYDAVIFDLDGTLVDSIQGIAAAVNYALREVEREEIPASCIQTFAGRGTETLFRDALGAGDEELIARCTKLKVDYEHKERHKLTKPFDGVDSMLKTLKNAGLKLAVLSNKEESVVQNIVSSFQVLEGMFDCVHGARSDKPLKPDPTVAKSIAEKMRVNPERCMYVGDTDVDMLTGTSAGLCAVGVTWGFRTEEELRDNGAHFIVNRPHEITGLILPTS